MSSGASLEELFEQGRPASGSIEIDQVLGSLHESFGLGPRPPVTIGRYRVAGRLGAGGLGIVYRGFDPSLQRFVAIKVLKAGKEAAQLDVRLLREAQVLAQIRHPHVVEVFDVGFFEDRGLQRFFVAMELVEGKDLRLWLAAGRSRSAICEAFVAAARGLAAAHETGLLHRDFKPSNVLMGNDGAIKVADFGLAAVTQEFRAEAGTTAWSAPEGATLSWRPGGTPHYMSPEQQRGEALTPASDQYGFCVSLYEALYGHRPFDASDRDALLAAKEQGPALPRSPRTTRAIRQLLRRGLALRPEDRFESMTALEHELARAQASSRRGWLGVGAVAIGAGATTLALTFGQPEPEPAAPSCATPPAVLQQELTITPALEPVLARSPPLREAWPAIAGALDAYADELRQRWDASCPLDEPVRSEVQRCLTECGNGLSALQDLFGRGDREALATGWTLVSALPDVRTCNPDEDGREGSLVDAAIDRARLLIDTGDLAEARRVLTAMRTYAIDNELAWARRNVDIEMAEIDIYEGHHAQAAQALEQAYFEAASEGDDLAAARAAVRMVDHGHRTGDLEGALQWSRTAWTQLERMQPRDHDLETVLWHNLALAHMVAGDLGSALTTIDRAVEHATAPGTSARLRAPTQQAQAELLMLNGRPAEALKIHTEVLHTRDALPQRDAMVSVVNLQSLGNALMTLHDVDGGWEAYRDSHRWGTSVLGVEHPHTVAACISHAWAQGERGEPGPARERLRPCLAQMVAQLGEDHPHVSLARAMSARLATLAGDTDAALPMFERALEVLERNFGQSHYAVGDVLFELGRAHVAAGDPAAAMKHLRRAMAVRETSLPEGHVSRGETMAELALLELAHGDPDEGERLMHRAIEIFEARGLPESYIQGLRRRLEER